MLFSFQREVFQSLTVYSNGGEGELDLGGSLGGGSGVLGNCGRRKEEGVVAVGQGVCCSADSRALFC